MIILGLKSFLAGFRCILADEELYLILYLKNFV